MHARSRAPAWSCYFACLLTNTVFVTTFHGTYNFKNKYKKFYNSIMLRSKLTIAGSNFIFGHINEHYNEYLSKKKEIKSYFQRNKRRLFQSKKYLNFKARKIKKRMGVRYK